MGRMELETEAGSGADIHEEYKKNYAPEKSALSAGRRDSNIRHNYQTLNSIEGTSLTTLILKVYRNANFVPKLQHDCNKL